MDFSFWGLKVFVKEQILVSWSCKQSRSWNNAKFYLTFLWLIWSWSSNRIFDRPINGREISSSVFGQTRRTRLYLSEEKHVFVRRKRCICGKNNMYLSEEKELRSKSPRACLPPHDKTWQTGKATILRSIREAPMKKYLSSFVFGRFKCICRL